ncbi:MAG: hypothetical protein OXI55_05885 [Gammaproteobacteria bacterium]|nr:hypothetical protein [Gammaproteobacteria bacterium]
MGDGLVPSRRALTGALAVRLRELLCFGEFLGAFKTGGDKPRPYEAGAESTGTLKTGPYEENELEAYGCAACSI